jgi:hypothetical protein
VPARAFQQSARRVGADARLFRAASIPSSDPMPLARCRK